MVVPAAPLAPLPPVVTVARPEQLSRWTVLLRIALLVPQWIVLVPLSVAAYLAVFVGWFAALALGRLPGAVERYLAAYVRYSARVGAYGTLLVDRYPPFRLGPAPAYPVQVQLGPGRLNRLAVLFRIVLQLPAVLLGALVGTGAAVVSAFVWVIALVLGRLPVPLFEAGCGLLRYNVRIGAYGLLVSSAYPTGLFGDRPGLPSLGARRMLALYVVLGVAGWAAMGSAVAAAGRLASPGVALDELGLAHDGLQAQVARFQQSAATCQRGADPLPCLEAADRHLAGAFQAFTAEVHRIDFPGAARGAADRLATAGDRMASALRRLAAARSLAEYERLSGTAGISRLGDGFDAAFQAAVVALGGSTA